MAGWWTYEFCYGKHIRQYHQEKDLPIRPQDEFYLGKQTSAEREVYTAKALALEEDSTSGNDMSPPYYSELYAHGTVCDITGQQRSTEVRFYCSVEKATLITDIKEPYSCSYIISVYTPLICKHPKYAPKQEETLPIACSAMEPPVDSAKHVDSFDVDDEEEEHYQAIKIEKIELKKKGKETEEEETVLAAMENVMHQLAEGQAGDLEKEFLNQVKDQLFQELSRQEQQLQEQQKQQYVIKEKEKPSSSKKKGASHVNEH